MNNKLKHRKHKRSGLSLILILVMVAALLTACSCSGSLRSTLEGIRDTMQGRSGNSEEDESDKETDDSRKQDPDKEKSDQEEESGSDKDESDREASDGSRPDDSGREESSQKPNEDSEIIHREDPAECKEVLAAFLDAYRNLDPDANVYLLDGGDEELSYDGFQGLLASSFTYEIGNVDMTYLVPYVSVTITNVDFKQILETYLESMEEDDSKKAESIVSELESLVNASDRPMRTFECAVPVYYLEEESGLKVEMTEELSNALTGGFAEFISNYLWSESGGQDSE